MTTKDANITPKCWPKPILGFPMHCYCWYDKDGACCACGEPGPPPHNSDDPAWRSCRQHPESGKEMEKFARLLSSLTDAPRDEAPTIRELKHEIAMLRTLVAERNEYVEDWSKRWTHKLDELTAEHSSTIKQIAAALNAIPVASKGGAMTDIETIINEIKKLENQRQQVLQAAGEMQAMISGLERDGMEHSSTIEQIATALDVQGDAPAILEAIGRLKEQVEHLRKRAVMLEGDELKALWKQEIAAQWKLIAEHGSYIEELWNELWARKVGAITGECIRTGDETEFLLQVRAELFAARAKFPESDGSMTALVEEVGELAKAMLDGSKERIRAEAVQVATMALRVAIEGDPTLDAYRQKRERKG